MADVAAGAEVEQFDAPRFRQPRRIIETAIGEKACIGADLGAVELKLDGAVKTDS